MPRKKAIKGTAKSMPNNGKASPHQEPKLPTFAAAPDFRTIYTNFANSSFTPFDIALFIGENMGVGQDGKMVVLQRAKVIMSPAEAKVVSLILVDTVNKFEKQFGKIELAKELMPTTIEGVPIAVEGV